MTADVTTQVYQVYIKTSAQRIWDAITQPEWTVQYGYGAPVEYDLRAGGAYRSTASDDMRKWAAENGYPMADTIVDGEVIEADPPRKLVQTWRMLMDPTTANEPFTTITYEIEESSTRPGLCRLTLTHELTGAPATAAMTKGNADLDADGGGGWPWILSDLKTLLETGSAFSR